MNPYYQDDYVTLYHGNCLQITDWLAADVLVTDPPYGINWGIHSDWNGGHHHPGINNDKDTSQRDKALALWGTPRPALVFGSPSAPTPAQVKQTLCWQKPEGSGVLGSLGGWRRDWEAIYMLGKWPQIPAQRSSIIKTNNKILVGHPHAKPVGLLEALISTAPDGTIADPFMGAGSALIAAKAQGRKAIGVEIEERYCEIAASRLAQDVLDFSEPA